MFEVVKLIVETLSKVLDPKSIPTLLRDRRKRELGAELFVLYVALNEVVTNGESIVSSLQTYCKRMEAHMEGNSDPYALTGGSWIEHKLVRQRTNLAKFGRSVQRLYRELQIIDAESYRNMKPLIEGKSNALDSLMCNLSEAKLPANGPTDASLRQLLLQDDERDFKAWDRQGGLALREEFDRGSLSAREPWNEQAYEIVERYLSTRKPRSQLEAISEVASNLKISLEKHFCVSDILLDVRDKRFDIDGDERFFW